MVSGFVDGNPDEPYTEILAVEKVTPLLGATRYVRLKALKLVPQLIEELNDEAEEALAAIENTKKLVMK